MIDWADPQLWYGFVGGWLAAAIVVIAVWGIVTLWRRAMEASE